MKYPRSSASARKLRDREHCRKQNINGALPLSYTGSLAPRDGIRTRDIRLNWRSNCHLRICPSGEAGIEPAPEESLPLVSVTYTPHARRSLLAFQQEVCIPPRGYSLDRTGDLLLFREPLIPTELSSRGAAENRFDSGDRPSIIRRVAVLSCN